MLMRARDAMRERAFITLRHSVCCYENAKEALSTKRFDILFLLIASRRHFSLIDNFATLRAVVMLPRCRRYTMPIVAAAASGLRLTLLMICCLSLCLRHAYALVMLRFFNAAIVYVCDADAISSDAILSRHATDRRYATLSADAFDGRDMRASRAKTRALMHMMAL